MSTYHDKLEELRDNLTTEQVAEYLLSASPELLTHLTSAIRDEDAREIGYTILDYIESDLAIRADSDLAEQNERDQQEYLLDQALAKREREQGL